MSVFGPSQPVAIGALFLALMYVSNVFFIQTALVTTLRLDAGMHVAVDTQ